MAEITVSILSWMLEDRLIKTLRQIPSSTTMPLNLCLHVQGVENISAEKKLEIIAAAEKFEDKDIYFTKGNQGTGKPRSELLPKSAKTPFVLITDNDMEFPQGGIDALYNFLTDEENSNYGIVNLVHNRQSKHNVVKGKSYERVPVNPTEHKVIYNIALMGSASMLVRKEIALLPNIIDDRYIVGIWDYDFCLNVREKGWKLATISDMNLIATNDKSYVNQTYRAARHQPAAIRAGLELYYQKWGDRLHSNLWAVKDSKAMFKKGTTWNDRIKEVNKVFDKKKTKKLANSIKQKTKREKLPKKSFSQNISSRQRTNFNNSVYAQ
jgi:GT2 family glycosyltransferase